MSAPKRFCPQCGKEQSLKAQFCKECGATLGPSPKVGWLRRQPDWVKITLMIAPLVLVGLIVGLAIGLSGGSSDGPDLGRAEIMNPDPASIVESDIYGLAAANNVLVVMEDGQGRVQAEGVAAQIGGNVVGEIELLNLYQIQTSGLSAEDLEAAMSGAQAGAGVKWVLANSLLVPSAPVQGKVCSPLLDPAYQSDGNYIPYEMIGMMEAIEIIKASQAVLNPVQVGVSDTPVYTNSGQGLATELHFPDAGGGYPDGEVQVRGLQAGDTTDAGGLTHGTEVTHVIAADWDDGVTGVAALLEGRLKVSCSSQSGGEPYVLPAAYSGAGMVLATIDTYAAGTLGSAFVELIQQARDGARVINMSWTAAKVPGPSSEIAALLFRDFLTKMNSAYENVLFVAAAGNEGEALTGTNNAPGGLQGLPNLITVGALDREGDRADMVDWSTEEEQREAYETLKAAGEVAAGVPFEEWIQRFVGTGGSNYAGPGGEVTLSACGTGVLVGRNADGTPVTDSGTSFAAPQVAAAAVLMRSLDPSLSAARIKEILVETADTEVTLSGNRVPVPQNVGGRVLRVDKAVLKVINLLRGPANELIYGDLIELATIQLTAEEHEFGYLVTATTPRVETPSGIDLRITVEGEAEIFGEETHRIYNSLESGTWTVAPGPDPVRVKVERLDNGACAFLELPGTGQTAESTTTTLPSATTTEKVAAAQWVMSGSAAVNPDNLPLEFYGGGANPEWFGEPRFEGKWLKYRPSATSFGYDERDVDHEFENFNVSIDCAFEPPPAALVPGETYELTVNCSSSGSVVNGNPGVQFWYSSEDVRISPDTVLAYYPWDPGFDGTSAKTYSFTAPVGSSGDTLQISASLWNAGQCWVVWTYTVE